MSVSFEFPNVILKQNIKSWYESFLIYKTYLLSIHITYKYNLGWGVGNTIYVDQNILKKIIEFLSFTQRYFRIDQQIAQH